MRFARLPALIFEAVHNSLHDVEEVRLDSLRGVWTQFGEVGTALDTDSEDISIRTRCVGDGLIFVLRSLGPSPRRQDSEPVGLVASVEKAAMCE